MACPYVERPYLTNDTAIRWRRDSFKKETFDDQSLGAVMVDFATKRRCAAFVACALLLGIGWTASLRGAALNQVSASVSLPPSASRRGLTDCVRLSCSRALRWEISTGMASWILSWPTSSPITSW